MKKSILFFLTIIFLSCAIVKNQKTNPFTGTFQVIVLDIEGVGDVPGVLTISKSIDEYTSKIVYIDDGVDTEMEILSSYEIDDSTFMIEAYVDGMQVDFELNFEDDSISGMASGIYEVEGSRTSK